MLPQLEWIVEVSEWVLTEVHQNMFNQLRYLISLLRLSISIQLTMIHHHIDHITVSYYLDLGMKGYDPNGYHSNFE